MKDEMGKMKVALLGATGAVGQRFVDMLNKHSYFELETLFGYSSAGKRYGEAVIWLLPTELPEEIKEKNISAVNTKDLDVDIVFSSLPSSAAKEVEIKFAKEGFPVLSNASAYRLHEMVPLVIPEVNPEHLEVIDAQKRELGTEGFIVTDPNCSTVGLSLALKPITNLYRVEKVVVNTLQAVSGAGYPGVSSLDIIDNVIPYIEKEEEKIGNETRKILGRLENNSFKDYNVKIHASCNRVPVKDGHLENVYLELSEKVDLDEVKEEIRNFIGEPQKLKLPTAPEKPLIIREEKDRPQPRFDKLAGSVPGMSVTIGRLRYGKNEKTLLFSLLVHNTIRGAAGCVLLLAELMKVKGFI